MESLVILVTIILAVTIFSGPIALFLTWLPALNRESTNSSIRLLRRVLVTVFSLIGSFTSFNIFVASPTLAVILMATFGSLTAFFAVKREYFPEGLGLGKRNRNGFGRKGDRRNGPSGQH